MPRTSVTTVAASPLGVVSALVTPDVAGSIVDVGNNLTLVVRNGSGGSINVTMQTPAPTADGGTVTPVVLAIAAGSTGFISLAPGLYARPVAPDAGRAYVDYSAITSVLVGVVQR